MPSKPLTSALLLLLSVTAGSAETDTAIAPKFLGSGSCSSSSCHGGVGALHDQYHTWSRSDFHSRAHAILFSARSARLAETLKISNPAQDHRCADCHTPFQSVPPLRRSTRLRASEGVSCESCHGAAELWLRSHTRADLSSAQKFSIGLRDLSTAYARANTCVACHQHIAPSIAQAGHPWLRFNLSHQLATMPPHWRDPSNGKPNLPDGQVWFIGLTVALREMSWHLLHDTGESEPHQVEWQAALWTLQQSGLGPIPDRLAPLADRGGAATPSSASVQGASGPSASFIQPDQLAVLIEHADTLARTLSALEWSATDLRSAWTRLLSAGTTLATLNPPVRAAVAAQLVAGYDSLSTGLRPEGIPSEAQNALLHLREIVRYQATFDSSEFAFHLGALSNL